MEKQLPNKQHDQMELDARMDKLYTLVFSSEQGRTILKDLTDEFKEVVLFDDNPYRTANKVGSRDVVMFILERMRSGQNLLIQEAKSQSARRKDEKNV